MKERTETEGSGHNSKREIQEDPMLMELFCIFMVSTSWLWFCTKIDVTIGGNQSKGSMGSLCVVSSNCISNYNYLKMRRSRRRNVWWRSKSKAVEVTGPWLSEEAIRVAHTEVLSSCNKAKFIRRGKGYLSISVCFI